MPDRKGPSDLVRYSHLGIQFAIVIVLGIFAGVWADEKFGTGSILTLVGTFAGAGIGFYVLYRETILRARSPLERATSERARDPHDRSDGPARDPDGTPRRHGRDPDGRDGSRD